MNAVYHGCSPDHTISPDHTVCALLTTPYRQNIPWLLSWPHRMSNNIINICFWLLGDLYEMFVLYRGKHATWSSTVGIWSTSISCTGPWIYCGLAVCRWASLQTTGSWCVNVCLAPLLLGAFCCKTHFLATLQLHNLLVNCEKAVKPSKKLKSLWVCN